MKKRISVDPKDVKPGDWVRVVGYDCNGRWESGMRQRRVEWIDTTRIGIAYDSTCTSSLSVRSIAEAEREVDEEPKVEVGT